VGREKLSAPAGSFGFLAMSSSDSQIQAVSGLLCLVLSLCALIAIRHVLRRELRTEHHSFGFGAFQHVHQRVESLICELRKEVSSYHQRCELLDVYTPEYFNTFQIAGWNEFKQLLSDLDYAQDVLDRLMESGEFEEAEDLANLLMGKLAQEDVGRVERHFQSLAHLRDWRKDAADRIVRLVQALELAANETKDLGINRQRRRKPTLLAIGELHTIVPK
jgi:hypothetical protein